MKKIFILFLILSLSLFAQKTEKYLTQAYIDSFIKNFNSMEKDLNALGIETQIEELESAKSKPNLYKKAAAALQKYSLGTKPYEVILAITYGTAGAIMEENIKTIEGDYPQMKDQYQVMADNYKKLVSPEDYKLVVKNIEKIKTVIGDKI